MVWESFVQGNLLMAIYSQFYIEEDKEKKHIYIEDKILVSS